MYEYCCLFLLLLKYLANYLQKFVIFPFLPLLSKKIFYFDSILCLTLILDHRGKRRLPKFVPLRRCTNFCHSKFYMLKSQRCKQNNVKMATLEFQNYESLQILFSRNTGHQY
uniref:Uncharacterized protein n=1 Tax=Cacopsylla melanoneura TaxID=428564 RepID=A0A8D8S2A9_9HEMI